MAEENAECRVVETTKRCNKPVPHNPETPRKPRVTPPPASHWDFAFYLTHGTSEIGERKNKEDLKRLVETKVLVKSRPLLTALQASKNIFPDEFIGLFRGKWNGEAITIEELIIPPLSDYGNGFSSYAPWFIPPNTNSIGSFHSHPQGPARPSRQDLQHFASNGPVHFIAAPPFTIKSTACFDAKGKKIGFEMK